MRIARLVVTQERLRELLKLPADAVVMVAEVSIVGSVDFLIHSNALPDQVEGNEPLRVTEIAP